MVGKRDQKCGKGDIPVGRAAINLEQLTVFPEKVIEFWPILTISRAITCYWSSVVWSYVRGILANSLGERSPSTRFRSKRLQTIGYPPVDALDKLVHFMLKIKFSVK